MKNDITPEKALIKQTWERLLSIRPDGAKGETQVEGIATSIAEFRLAAWAAGVKPTEIRLVFSTGHSCNIKATVEVPDIEEALAERETEGAGK